MPPQQRLLTYNIKVEVHELQSCRFSEGGKDILPNPYVEVCVFGERKSTPKRQQAASATFDSQFNFTVSLTPEELALATVEIAVYHAYMFSSALIGSVVFSCIHVYGRPQHWLYREWACIRHSGNPAEPSGYILLTVGVFGAGDAIPVVDDTLVQGPLGDDAGVKRLTGVPDLKFQSFNMTINIHRGHDIVAIPTSRGTVVPSPFSRVKHGGFVETTRTLTGSSPEWNTSILLPAFLPSHDDNVLIELGHGTPESDPLVLGVRGLQLQKLIQKQQEPIWLNFYYRCPPTGLIGNLESWFTKTPGAGFSEPTSFAGRVLVSANVQKIQIVSAPSARPSPVVPEPPITEYTMFADIYEVTSTIGSVGRIQVELAMGTHTQRTPFIHYVNDAYVCDEQIGRLAAAKLYLPPLNQACDIFLYIVGAATETTLFGTAGVDRVAFARMPLRDHLGFESKPWWCILRNMTTGYEAFSVLMTLHCGPSAQAPAERQPRLTYSLKSYLFRSMIYEGVNMPCFSESELPNASVRVELAGRSSTTRAVENNLNPAWYEAFEIEVSLPDNLTLAPDVNVEVVSSTNSSFSSGTVTLGHFTFPISRIPVLWDVYPEWQDLRAGSDTQALQHGKGKILCSFELLPATRSMIRKYPFFDDIRPSTYPGTVQFLLIGIRMFKEIRDPEVTIAYGRDYEKSANYLWAENTGPPSRGQGGNWNFLKEVKLDVALPKRHIHNAMLELTVTDKTQGFGGEVRRQRGCCYVLLTPQLPWLTDLERAAAADAFKIWTLEEVLLEAADVASDPNNALLLSPSSFAESKKAVHARLRVPNNDLDTANCQAYLPDDYLAYDENEEQAEELLLLQQLAADTQLNTVVERTSTGDKPNAAAETQEKFLEKARGSNQDEFGMYRKFMNFDLLLPDDDGGEDEGREEIPHELEADIGTSLLPYHTVPIIKSTVTGIPETVGYAKYICTVYQAEQSTEEEHKFQAVTDRIKNQYTQTRDLVVRVYILSARGLIPPSGSSDPSVYVWVKNADEEVQTKVGTLLPHNIRDSGNVRRQGFRPEFNKCYTLQCAIPDHAIVQIALLNTGGLSEELVGATHIDVEDRWFNPKFQLLLKRDCVPVEQRTLKLEGRMISQGSLRVWVELMTHEASLAKPVTVLASPDPEDYQLRMVIWSIKNVPLGENASVSVFVRGTYHLDNANVLTQDTDVHYNSRDGSGRFNWRFVWDIKIPAQQAVVKLQIFNSHFFLQGAEPVSECNIDLSYDFAAARKRYTANHIIPATWYRCSHPARPGEDQGMIYAEVFLLPAKEADFAPVGKGRDEPNRNPYLEPVTENRTYVDWKQVGEQVSSITTSMMANARYGCVVTAVVFVVGGIVLLIVLLR